MAIATAHILGGVTFDYDANQMDIPEAKKTVAEKATYEGSAIFQWPAFIQGTNVSLSWKVMPVAQYNSLLALYLSADTITWNPQYLGTYQVIVTDFKGKYVDVALNNHPFREDVELVLNIRSGPV